MPSRLMRGWQRRSGSGIPAAPCCSYTPSCVCLSTIMFIWNSKDRQADTKVGSVTLLLAVADVMPLPLRRCQPTDIMLLSIHCCLFVVYRQWGCALLIGKNARVYSLVFYLLLFSRASLQKCSKPHIVSHSNSIYILII